MKTNNKTTRGKRIAFVLFAAAIVFSTVIQAFLPSDAMAAVQGEAGVKQTFYRSAVYDCLAEAPDILKKDISIGQPISSIFDYNVAVMHYAKAGSWVGDNTSGEITCWDAIQNAGFTGNITEDSLKSGKILNGVYEKSNSTEKQLFCGYNILLESEAGLYQGTDGKDKVFWWPQGFNSDNANSLTLPRHGFYYNASGWVNKGDTVNLVYDDVTYSIDTFEEASDHATFDSSDFQKVCHDLVKGISVLGYGTFDNGDGKGVKIKPIKSTDDKTPLKEWGLADWVHDYANAAAIHHDYIYTEIKDTGKSTALVKKSGAEAALKTNLKKLWFDNKEPKAYYEANADYKYVTYGRALFNGDSGYPMGCNGLSLEATKENKEWAANSKVWNTGNEYVKTMKAYKKKGDSSKTEFITKFGYGGKDDAGYMISISALTPWDSVWSCEDLVGKFNSATASNSKTKQDVITYMGIAEKPDDITKPDDPTKPNNPDNPDDGGKTKSEELEEACYRQAKSLGWIICPIIFGLQEVTTQIYEKIEPMIRVNDSVLDQIRQGNESGSGSMFQAWNTFRGIANIVFVILFLFIIFSQLTGVGIDNYGIKKMLPKVIITAILVNISFLICALAVDTSNVLGRSLQDLFTNIAPSNKLMGGSIVDGTISTINTAVGVLGLVAAGGATVAAVALNGWAIIIPILLFLLVMIISIIFALIVLGLRQAFVVILIVISPIAFACTLLPNTEKVFKKWVEFFKQILMVYPIVGGLIGAGYFVACMIFTSNADLIMTVTAGMLCVAPYFMVPSLTRKSLAAAGNIGERLRGLGQGAGRRVRGLNNTDAVKNARANSRAARDESRAQRWMNSRRAQKIQDDMAAGKTVSRRRANKYAQKAALATQSRQASIAARSAQSQYGRLSSQSGYQAAMSAANMAEDATTTKNFETMLAAGDYKYDTGRVDADGNAIMQTIDAQNNDQIAEALQHELQQTGDKYDANKVRALTNALAAKGKEGRNLMFDAVKNAQNNGASQQAIKDFSGNIMSNHAGTMKEKHRSIYEFAKNTAGMEVGSIDNRGANNISNYAASGVGSLNASDMTNMDIKQLERFRDNVSTEVDPKTGKSDAQILAGLANDALTDEHLSQNLSDKTRSELQRIAQMGGYTPPTAQSADLKVDHGSTSTPVAPAQTEAARSAGANTATVRATQISDATRARAAEQGRVNPEVERAIDQSNKGGGRQTDSGIWLPS